MPNPKDIDLQKLKKASQFAAEPIAVNAVGSRSRGVVMAEVSAGPR
jgi:hypothetical protein